MATLVVCSFSVQDLMGSTLLCYVRFSKLGLFLEIISHLAPDKLPDNKAFIEIIGPGESQPCSNDA